VSRWVDISVPVHPGMPVWPDNPSTELNLLLSIADGDAANVSHLSLGTHTGTHMDAPRHFLANRAPMDALPIEAVIGPARVVAIEDPERVTAAELARHAPRTGERLVLRSRNSPRCWGTDEFVEDFVYVSEEAARL
jgi:arylformamidase